jgi:hypothetical protein
LNNIFTDLTTLNKTFLEGMKMLSSTMRSMGDRLEVLLVGALSNTARKQSAQAKLLGYAQAKLLGSGQAKLIRSAQAKLCGSAQATFLGIITYTSKSIHIMRKTLCKNKWPVASVIND